jgi:glycosyltransferase involved in cell wall biosynthesis
MEGIQGALRQEGFTADFRPPGFRSIQDWDLVHLMHIAFPWSIEIADHCIAQEHPYVVSAILFDVESLSDFQRVGSHAAAIIAASGGERQALLSHCREFEDKIVVIPLGVDPSWFTVPDAPLDLGERYVVCAGRYEPLKRQKEVLEACRQIGARVVFAGGPDCDGSWQYYEELVALNYEKAMFLKQMPPAELQRLFYGAHVVCQASEYESFGLTGIEAAAAGANLVMTNRTLAVDQFGWASFCDPDSVDSIAAALGEQYEAPRVPKPRPLSWAEVARRILPVYLSALGSRNC